MTGKHDQMHGLDEALDDLFAQARSDALVPSKDFLARVSQDASEVQVGFHSDGVIQRTPDVPWWKLLLEEIGGVPALGGMVASVCMGIYLGVVNPDLADSLRAVDNTDVAEAEGVMTHALLGDLFWVEEG